MIALHMFGYKITCLPSYIFNNNIFFANANIYTYILRCLAFFRERSGKCFYFGASFKYVCFRCKKRIGFSKVYFWGLQILANNSFG